MTEDEVERRAKALADVILELLFAKDFRDADRVKRDDRQRTLAENEAYWVVYSLKDPAGEVGLWHAKTQVELLETALKGLGKAEKAIRQCSDHPAAPERPWPRGGAGRISGENFPQPTPPRTFSGCRNWSEKPRLL